GHGNHDRWIGRQRAAEINDQVPRRLLATWRCVQAAEPEPQLFGLRCQQRKDPLDPSQSGHADAGPLLNRIEPEGPRPEAQGALDGPRVWDRGVEQTDEDRPFDRLVRPYPFFQTGEAVRPGEFLA